MIKTVKQLIDELRCYDDNTLVSILFECTESNTQYEVPILAIAGTEDHIRLCHEEDYPDHYSKKKNNEESLEQWKDNYNKGYIK